MKFSRFMTAYAVVSGLFGVGFVILPGLVLDIYGMSASETSLFIGQLLGATLISLALLGWLAKNASQSEARHAIVLAMFVGEAFGLVLAVMGQLRGVMNGLGWLVVAVYLIFTIGLGYFQFVKKVF